jgi:zinc and cadmium transporter
MILYILGLLISFGAGAWFIIRPPENRKWLSLFLSAGGAFLMAIIFTHIIPEVFLQIPNHAGIILLVGFLIQIFLENYSKGIEHGHVHPSTNNKAMLISYLALCAHELIEGMPLLYALNNSGDLFSRQLVLGVMMHKIPVAITLATLMVKQGFKPFRSFLLLAGFILCTVFGSAIQHFLGSGILVDSTTWMYASLGLTVGILLHVSTTILFESSDHHHLKPSRILVIALGIVFGIMI